MGMLHVKNRRVIRRLAWKSLAAKRARNLVAVAAIALTSLLFTALFTIAGSLMDTFQQQTFRQVGGDFPAGFKKLSREQLDELKDDPLITSYGTRLMLGVADAPPLNKAYVEVSYMDAVQSKGSFCKPETGRLPAEGTKELACDTNILKLLGITPALGAQVPLTVTLGAGSGQETILTDTFTLSGWWECDPAGMACMVLLPRSYVEQALDGYVSAAPEFDSSGAWFLNFYLRSTAHIEADAATILNRHGYQSTDSNADNYIGVGINWAYLSSSLESGADPLTIAALAFLLSVILLTGYLIIYNIFQISVSADIRFYGLLKTIGTTPRQLGGIVRWQALALCAAGIPLGLVGGHLLGRVLAPATTAMLSYNSIETSAKPWIFVGAAMFSLATVFLSCRRPAGMAAKVSPVEAVRYTEGGISARRTTRRSKHGGSPIGMAAANLGRTPGKTALVVVSLSLAAVLFQITWGLAQGFDMDKYLQVWVVSDFVLSDAGYFNNHSDNSMTLEDVQAVEDSGLAQSISPITQNYGVLCFEPEEFYLDFFSNFVGEEQARQSLSLMQKDANGNVAASANVYGMDALAQSKLDLIEGDLSALNDPSQNAIAAVCYTDDFGELTDDFQFAKMGDTVTLRYVEEWEYFDSRTGEPVEDTDSIPAMEVSSRAAKWHDVEYTVAALVSVPRAMSFRHYSGAQFVLGQQALEQDGSPSLLNCLIETDDDQEAAMQTFLEDYTQRTAPHLNFESKQGYVSTFLQLRNTFLLLGGVLSAVVALVGVLNFLNAVLTSMLSRRREFAVLQAVGMTNRQLNVMLMTEGLLYALLAAAVSLALSLLAGAAMRTVVGNVLWFFTYRFSLMPLAVLTPVFLLLGLMLPAACCRIAQQQSIVDRLRQSE